jgi:hypothetical protein
MLIGLCWLAVILSWVSCVVLTAKQKCYNKKKHYDDYGCDNSKLHNG